MRKRKAKTVAKRPKTLSTKLPQQPKRGTLADDMTVNVRVPTATTRMLRRISIHAGVSEATVVAVLIGEAVALAEFAEEQRHGL